MDAFNPGEPHKQPHVDLADYVLDTGSPTVVQGATASNIHAGSTDTSVSVFEAEFARRGGPWSVTDIPGFQLPRERF